jgi:hypothetical protein
MAVTAVTMNSVGTAENNIALLVVAVVAAVAMSTVSLLSLPNIVPVEQCVLHATDGCTTAMPLAVCDPEGDPSVCAVCLSLIDASIKFFTLNPCAKRRKVE